METAKKLAVKYRAKLKQTADAVRSLTRRSKPRHMTRLTAHKFRMICAGSFFNGCATRVYRTRRMRASAAVTVCAALILAVTLTAAMFRLAVYMNGNRVGATRSFSDAAKIVSSAEGQITEILGYEYSLGDSLSFSADLGTADVSAEDIERAIIASVDGIEEKYVLTVEGGIVGASEYEEELLGLLSGILEGYSTEATSSIRFAQQVQVGRQFVAGGVVSDPEAIIELLAPENEESEFSLAVESVESALRSEETPFETEYIEDDTLYEGERKVVTEGRRGVVLVTETVNLLNGVEQSRDRIGKVNASSPVTEVVAVGIAPRPDEAPSDSYAWPASGRISSGFGPRSVSVGSSNHKGIDIAGGFGQDICAAEGGEVVFAGKSGGYGYMVRLRHDNGHETLYAHCSELLVSDGESVVRGQKIALMGSTGTSTGVHVHFELIIDGAPIDPMPYLA